MNKFILIFPAVLLLAAGCNTINSDTSSSQSSFDPSLVQAKQQCQDSFQKWAKENTGSGTNGTDQAIRAHFNPSLNTCLVDYIYNRADGTQQNSVIDIYENRKLLELDIESQSTPQPGMFLYDHGQAVKLLFGDLGEEYNKRRSALFEEPVANH